MALKYGEVNKFVRKNGDVKVIAGKGAKMTLLKSGRIDSVSFVETDATHFRHNGKTYSRKQFEKLVQASEKQEEE
jgi:hypothetical protein